MKWHDFRIVSNEYTIVKSAQIYQQMTNTIHLLQYKTLKYAVWSLTIFLLFIPVLNRKKEPNAIEALESNINFSQRSA